MNMSETPSDTTPAFPGRYQHYKGQLYTVLGIARHSESDEAMVVYRQEYGEYGLWVRPRDMFEESVMVEGHLVPRFRRLADDEEAEPKPS